MAKKSDARWHGSDAKINNPFAALASKAAPPAEPPETSETPAAPKAVKLPKFKSAHIERTGRAGKTVTVVTFHGSPDEIACTAWLKSAKKSLGIGGSVEDGHVILQGDQTDRIKSL